MPEKRASFDFSALNLDKTNDPVRLYLREMGTVPLLSREGEVEIAKRVEHGQRVILKALSRSPLVVQEILDVGEQLKKKQISIRDVVPFNEDEITEEKLEEKAAAVLEVIESIRKHERAAHKIRLKLSHCRKKSRLYKKHLSMLARYRIPIAWKVRALELSNLQHDRLIGVIKDTVDKVIAYEREIHKLKRSLETPRRRG